MAFRVYLEYKVPNMICIAISIAEALCLDIKSSYFLLKLVATHHQKQFKLSNACLKPPLCVMCSCVRALYVSNNMSTVCLAQLLSGSFLSPTTHRPLIMLKVIVELTFHIMHTPKIFAFMDDIHLTNQSGLSIQICCCLFNIGAKIFSVQSHLHHGCKKSGLI